MNEIVSQTGLKRIVVLGHSGFIGSHLCRYLESLRLGIEIVGESLPEMDLTTSSGAKVIAPYFDMNTLVIMCAGVKKQYGDSLDIYVQNMDMVINICSLLDQHPVQRFLFFSSAEVYGQEVHDINITEQTPVQPSSYYGAAKYASECLLTKTYEKIDDGTLLIVRPTLVYGPHEEGTFYGPTGFIRMAHKKEPIVLWGDGQELREFLYIDDIVNAVVQLAFSHCQGVFNIVGGGSRSYAEALDIALNLIPYDIEVKHNPRTRKKVDQAYQNCKLAKNLPELKFTSLEDGMEKIYNLEYRQ